MGVRASAEVCAAAAWPHHQVWVPSELQELFSCVLPPADAVGQPTRGGSSQALFGLSGPLAGIYFHRHPAGFNEVIHGKKLWMAYDADTYEALEARDTFHTRAASSSAGAASAAAQLVGDNPDLRTSVWFLRRVLPYLLPAERPLRCVAEQGDVIFVPSGSVHLTMNLGQTMFAVCPVQPSAVRVT